MQRVNISRRAVTVLGIAAAAVLAIGGVAVAASDDDRAPGRAATVAATDSPSPADSPSPDDTPSPDDSPSPSGSAPSDDPTPGDDAAVSRDLAVVIALERVGGGTVTNVESEWEDGRAMWKVRIVKNGVRYDVYVDKATGEVMRLRQKTDNSGGDVDNSGGDDSHDDNGGGDNSHDDNSGADGHDGGSNRGHGGSGH